MALKKDKQKVLDEVWTQERIRGFLDLQPLAGESTDFHQLFRAYQSMRADDFREFVTFFCQAGKDLNALNGQGQTVISIVKDHRHGKDFVEILLKAGATEL